MNKTIEILISKRSCNFQEQCISNYNWSKGFCKIEVRHILFKKIFFLIFLNNHLTDY
jgi:hypothetical protein